MTPALSGTDLKPPENHGSFQDMFRFQVQGVAHLLRVERGKLADYDGNESLEGIQWEGSPIELIFVDCGRSLSVNEAWWVLFQPSFIPDRTLIVMQDWRNYSRVPELFWENTKLFSDGHADELDLVHETVDGAIATFVFRGRRVGD